MESGIAAPSSILEGPIATPYDTTVLEAASGPDSINLKAIPTRDKRTAIFIQDECLKHRFVRSRDTTGVYERPERLRAVKLGLAAALSRIEEVQSAMDTKRPEVASTTAGTDEGDLAAAIAHMAISPPTRTAGPAPIRISSVVIRRTSASVSLLDHAAVKYIHGDIDRDVYLENLIAWARDSQANITKKGTEIPEGIPPLDLYLCPGSIDAIQGAIGAVCEAVDASVMATRRPWPLSGDRSDGVCERAFVAIRPPGHHCGEDTPSGFCLINNVTIGAAHAFLNHGIQRIVILDIDLHHGNGTQSIVWQINEETYRQTLESERPGDDAPPAKPGPRVFYGSLHDILSFPCEDGKPEMVQAASTSIHGPHGQYIENIHLQRYESETQFWGILYPQYLALLHRVRDFLDETGGPGDDVLVFISCGFDAGEHEYPSMSRHHRKVPVGFYHRFTRETCKLADVYAHGRVVSVLEGGYSDRALTSGAMAHFCGLVDLPGQAATLDSDGWVNYTWWDKSNLIKLEKAAKPRKSASARASMDEWLARTIELLPVLGGGGADIGLKTSPSSVRETRVGGTDIWAPPTSMILRERNVKKPDLDGSRAGGAPLDSVRSGKKGGRSVPGASGGQSTERTGTGTGTSATGSTLQAPSLGVPNSGSGSGDADPGEAVPSRGTEKKLPRVILHVRPPPPDAPS